MMLRVGLFGFMVLCALFGVSQSLEFTMKPGFYEESFELGLIAERQVFYTLDGSRPDKTSFKFSKKLKISKSVVVRAVIYLGEGRKEIQGSFFIGEKTRLPVVSIIGDPEDFWSEDKGIYVKGCCAEDKSPYMGANFWKGWEKSVLFEYFVGQERVISQGVGVKIFGGYSKGMPMKSLSIMARKKYGKKYLKYPFFDNRDISQYKNVVLRNGGGDFNVSHFRDPLLTGLGEDVGLDVQASKPVVVYLNGEFLGVHNLREKINEHFIRSHHGTGDQEINLLKHQKDVQIGSRHEYLKMLKFIKSSDFSNDQLLRELSGLMDVEGYIDYNILQVYIDNHDAGGNIRFWNLAKTPSIWKWILFDLDLSYGASHPKNYKNNTLDLMTKVNKEAWPHPSWSTLVIRGLLENDSLSRKYVDRFNDLLNTKFSEEQMLHRIDSMYTLYKPEMKRQFKRWRNGSMDVWEYQMGVLRKFAKERPSYVRSHLKEKFALGDTISVAFQFNSDQSQVFINGVPLDSGQVWKAFENWSLEVKVLPRIGLDLARWAGEESIEKDRVVRFSSDTTVALEFGEKVYSDLVSSVFINEVCFSQDSLNYSEDWLELHNASDQDIDLKGWGVKNENGNIFTIQSSPILRSGKTIVIRKSYELFEANYPNCEIVSDTMRFGFGNVRDEIMLYDSEGMKVDSVYYNVDVDFPEIKNNSNRCIVRSEKGDGGWEIAKLPTPGTISRFEVVKAYEEGEESFFWYLIYMTLGVVLGGGVVYFLRRNS